MVVVVPFVQHRPVTVKMVPFAGCAAGSFPASGPGRCPPGGTPPGYTPILAKWPR